MSHIKDPSIFGSLRFIRRLSNEKLLNQDLVDKWQAVKAEDPVKIARRFWWVEPMMAFPPLFLSIFFFLLGVMMVAATYRHYLFTALFFFLWVSTLVGFLWVVSRAPIVMRFCASYTGVVRAMKLDYQTLSSATFAALKGHAEATLVCLANEILSAEAQLVPPAMTRQTSALVSAINHVEEKRRAFRSGYERFLTFDLIEKGQKKYFDKAASLLASK